MAPIKLAIIGAGPSSFYVASRLLSLLPQSSPRHSALKIHMYDRLWAPHGLVRYGVAPDHPEVKNCTHKFDATAEDPRLKFFGNVNIATTTPNVTSPISHNLSLPFSALLQNYTHILFSSGCTIPTLHPSLPLSEHCVPALNFVHWYTQHPSVTSKPPPPLERLEHVSIIGQGNVSLDVARMLLTPPSTLEKYDVPNSVLEVLRRSAVKHVSIIGRRGAFEAAFTTKELREMMNLEEAAMEPLDPGLLVPREGEQLTRQQQRTVQLLQKGSKNVIGSTPKSWSLEFFRSPTHLGLATPADSLSMTRPLSLTLAHNSLTETKKAVATGASSSLRTSMVVTSLGHGGEPTPWYDSSLGHFRTVGGGRVVNSEGRVLRNVYASGWAAMGAKGVLASTMMDAYNVAGTILSDAFPGEFRKNGEGDGDDVEGESLAAEVVLPEVVESDVPPVEVEVGLREGEVVDYSRWKLVDEEEMRRGAVVGKERERMGWEEARAFLRQRMSSHTTSTTQS